MALFGSKPKDPNALLAKGKYKDALKGFQAILDNNPEDINARIKLADTCVHLKKVDDAVHHFEVAAEDYAQKGFLIKAIALHKKILKISPGREENHKRLAELDAEHRGVTTKPKITARKAAPEADPVTAEVKILDATGASPAADPALDFDDSATRDAMETIEDASDGKSKEEGSSKNWERVRVPLFSDLSPEQFQKVVEKIKHHEFKENDVVIREGDKGASMFVISEGEVRVLTHDPQGQEVALTTLGEGDFFGEVSLLKGVARTATIIADSSCEILEFTRADMDEIAKTQPSIMKVIENFYMERVSHTIETMKDRLRSR